MTFLKKHGVVGPVFCAAIVIGSVYGGIVAVGQIRKEWGLLKRASRQDWKSKLIESPKRD